VVIARATCQIRVPIAARGAETLDSRIRTLIDDATRRPGLVTVLTGAGISAASGIPTFRGPEGYWTVGSQEFTPQQLATRAMFARAPDDVWGWYLYRLGVCRTAEPNAAHHAVVRLEQALGDRFLLITQNVDGLHLRAGNTPLRTFPVHGEIEWARCADDCSTDRVPIPDGVTTKRRGEPLTDDDRAALRCARCAARLRPHVLWFDETYDEPRFHFDSALRAAGETALLVTVGTSGATTLPALVTERAAATGATIIDVNPEDNPFGDLAERSGGAAIRRPATDALPDLADLIAARHGS
jgi:NAD-dependent deacetylase